MSKYYIFCVVISYFSNKAVLFINNVPPERNIHKSERLIEIYHNKETNTKILIIF
jgi:LAS superfamily LD-carboxypeptidase LdcB